MLGFRFESILVQDHDVWHGLATQVVEICKSNEGTEVRAPVRKRTVRKSSPLLTHAGPDLIRTVYG